jgi:hypothetical protein
MKYKIVELVSRKNVLWNFRTKGRAQYRIDNNLAHLGVALEIVPMK